MARNRRKRKNKSKAVLIVALCLFLAVIIAIAAAYMYVQNDITGNRGDVIESTITIEQGSSVLTIANTLQDAGIIYNAQIFRYVVGRSDKASTLQYGQYTLTSDLSYDEIVELMQQTQDYRETVMVTFPEGITALSFAQRMEDAGLCTVEEFIDVANNGDFSHLTFWNKRDIVDNVFMPCEGFLFPETYEFFVGDDVYNMVEKIYAEFDKRFTAEMYTQIEAMGFTLSEFITLTSIVQEEAGHPSQQANVAAVFMARLAPGSIEPRLQSNTASHFQHDGDNNYVLNTIAWYYGGWDNIPQNILDSYNTYEMAGLPAGPISNPGIDAMLNTIAYQTAEYYDAQNPYYFFITDPEGNYYYNRDVNAHEAKRIELYE